MPLWRTWSNRPKTTPPVHWVELMTSSGVEPAEVNTVVSKPVNRLVVAILVGVVIAAIGLLVIAGDDPAPGPAAEAKPEQPTQDRTLDGTEAAEAIPSPQAAPSPQLAAELFAAAPSGQTLRGLLEALGGLESLEVASAEGAFDLVRFDPNDADRLLATHRLSYGRAENQADNELWQITGTGQLEQTAWAPSVPHDFVHYNVDGTATMWVHGGGTGFAPRIAVTLLDGFAPSQATEPIYASRFTSAAGRVFALTGTGDYYTNSTDYVALVADDGNGQRTLDDGAGYGWIDNPTADIMIAYPADQDGVLTVWSVTTLEQLPNHPLSGRSFERVAISADQRIAVGATFDGVLEVIDLVTGQTRDRFGSVAIGGVDVPITLNAEGTIAVIVEATGRVSMWWVGEDEPVLTVAAHQAQPRWLSAEYAARSTSVVSADAARVALLASARPGTRTRWTIVDIDPQSWVRRACDRSDRALTDRERTAFDLHDQPSVCTNSDN